MSQQCSELFARVFASGCFGTVRTCVCGVTHFDGSSPDDFDPGELPRLKARAELLPAYYVDRGSTVATMSIGGVEIVDGCTCDLAAKYEQFILAHAEKLAEYLREHATALREKADAVDVPEGGP